MTVFDMQLADYRVANPVPMDMLAPPDAQNRYSIKQQLEVQKVNHSLQQVCNNSLDTNFKACAPIAQHSMQSA